MKNLDRDKTYNNIIQFLKKRRQLKKINPKISVTFVRTSLNVNELNDFIKFWKEYPLDNIHNFELMNWNGKVLDYDNLIDKPKIIPRQCPEYDNPLVIDAYGDIVRCCYDISFSYGNVFDNGIDKYLAKKRISDTYPDFDCIKCDGWKI